MCWVFVRMLTGYYYSEWHVVKAWHLSSSCSAESSTEARDYGSLERAAHVWHSFTATSEALKQNNPPCRCRAILYACAGSCKVKRNVWQIAGGHTEKSEARRNIKCFTWVNLREHESRAWTRPTVCGSDVDESSQSGRINEAEKI